LKLFLKIFLGAGFLLLLAACGPSDLPEPTITPAPTATPMVIRFPTPVPTPTPIDFQSLIRSIAEAQSSHVPEPPPSATPVPTITTPEVVHDQATPSTPVPPQPTALPTQPPATPVPTLPPTPRPTATPAIGYYAPTPPAPAIEGLESAFDGVKYQIQWAGSVTRIVTITGHIDRPAKSSGAPKPTVVQIWQAVRTDGEPDCNTERPIAFIIPSPNDNDNAPDLGTTPHRWRYCQQDTWGNIIADALYVTDVPWFYADEWKWESRQRKRTTDPFIWDFKLTADFASDQSIDQEYRSPKGWRIVVYSEDKIIGYFWVDI
jgi:hypothetical protein